MPVTLDPPLPTATGTITLTQDSATITGTGTGFKRLRVGDAIVAGNGVAVLIGVKPTSNLSATLSTAYTGDTLTDVTYSIWPRALYAQAAAYFEMLNIALSAQEGQFVWLWNTATASGDPGEGFVQANNATWTSATTLYLSDIDQQSNDIGDWLATWAGSRSVLTSLDRPGVFAFATIGVVTDSTGYRTIALSSLVGAPAFTSNERIAIRLMPSGIQGIEGDPGINGSDGIDGASNFFRVRVVDTTGAAPATAYEAGDTIDSVTLAENDHVLRATSGGNAADGVYLVPASGAASRATAFAAYDDMPGCYFSVMEGTVNGDTLWRCTSNKGGTLDSTALVFEEFTSGGVTGLGSTDNALLRANGTGGETAQGSAATLSDAGVLTTAAMVATISKSDTVGPGTYGEFRGKDELWGTRTGTDDSFNIDTYAGGNVLKITSAGRVLKPKTPRFNAYLNASFYPNTSTLTALGSVWSNARCNVGSHFATGTGRFTAPVAGDYRFVLNANGYLASSGLQLWLYKNGSAIAGGGCYMEISAGVWTQAAMEIIIPLALNDYVEVYGYSYNAGNFFSSAYTNFSGELVG